MASNRPRRGCRIRRVPSRLTRRFRRFRRSHFPRFRLPSLYALYPYFHVGKRSVGSVGSVGTRQQVHTQTSVTRRRFRVCRSVGKRRKRRPRVEKLVELSLFGSSTPPQNSKKLTSGRRLPRRRPNYLTARIRGCGSALPSSLPHAGALVYRANRRPQGHSRRPARCRADRQPAAVTSSNDLRTFCTRASFPLTFSAFCPYSVLDSPRLGLGKIPAISRFWQTTIFGFILRGKIPQNP